jgi:hypothetical protein
MNINKTVAFHHAFQKPSALLSLPIIKRKKAVRCGYSVRNRNSFLSMQQITG